MAPGGGPSCCERGRIDRKPEDVRWGTGFGKAIFTDPQNFPLPPLLGRAQVSGFRGPHAEGRGEIPAVCREGEGLPGNLAAVGLFPSPLSPGALLSGPLGLGTVTGALGLGEPFPQSWM